MVGGSNPSFTTLKKRSLLTKRIVFHRMNEVGSSTEMGSQCRRKRLIGAPHPKSSVALTLFLRGQLKNGFAICHVYVRKHDNRICWVKIMAQ